MGFDKSLSSLGLGRRTSPSWSRAFCWGDPEKSYHAPHRVTDHDVFDNRLIVGDKLIALKDLRMSRARIARM